MNSSLTSSTNRSLSFLFTLWEGGGNVPPALSVARRLINMGHKVRFLGDSCQPADVERSGVEFIPWTLAPNRRDKSPSSDPLQDWEISQPLQLMAKLRDELFFGPAGRYAADTRNEIRRESVDCLVSSEMLFGPAIAAESFGIPSVFLASNIYPYPRKGVPPFGPGFAPARNFLERFRDSFVSALSYREFGKATNTYNKARADFGLEPLKHPFEQIALVNGFLVLSSEHFDFPAEEMIPNLVYAGPELGDPSWTNPWESPWRADDQRPLVLVGLSTTFQNQAGLLQKIADALFQLPVRGVITTGPSIRPEDIRGGENLFICQSAPHSEILKEASAMVTHCGHGSVMKGLAAGVPLLCIPMGRDQNDNAVRVTHRGAGLQLSPKASVSEISNSISQLLNAPNYKVAASELGRKLLHDHQHSQAVSALESWARGGRISCRSNSLANNGKVVEGGQVPFRAHFQLGESF